MVCTNDHKTHPEIWLQPSPSLPLEVLLNAVKGKHVTATPRLGARNGNHRKGYKQGQIATLRVFDDTYVDHLHQKVRIRAVTTRPLQELTSDDLGNTVWYQSWQDVQRELSFFEKRPVGSSEEVSIVKFLYL